MGLKEFFERRRLLAERQTILDTNARVEKVFQEYADLWGNGDINGWHIKDGFPLYNTEAQYSWHKPWCPVLVDKGSIIAICDKGPHGDGILYDGSKLINGYTPERDRYIILFEKELTRIHSMRYHGIISWRNPI